MAEDEAPRVAVTLQVKAQGDGDPRWYARWRWEGREVTRGLDALAWMVRADAPGGRPNGQRVGRWKVKAGRAPEGWLEPGEAQRLVPGVVEAWWSGVVAEREAAREAEHVTVREAIDAYLRLGTEGPDDADEALGVEAQPWARSTANANRTYARRIARELGEERPLREVTTAELLSFMRSLRPMRNGAPMPEDPPAFVPSVPVEDEDDDERLVRLEADEERREEEMVEWRVKRTANLRKLRSNYAPVLRGATRYAVVRGWLDSDPCAALPPYGAPKKSASDPLRDVEFLNPSQINAVLDAMRETAAEYRLEHPPLRTGRVRERMRLYDQDPVALLLGTHAGLRPSEMMALRWRDVLPDSLVIRQARVQGFTKVPKSGAGRTVPLTPVLTAALDELRQRPRYVGPDDLVLVGFGGGHVAPDKQRERFRAAQVAAGIAPPRPLRGMRNSYGTALASIGVPARTIQAYMGHSSLAVTERYMSFAPRATDAELVASAFDV